MRSPIRKSHKRTIGNNADHILSMGRKKKKTKKKGIRWSHESRMTGHLLHVGQLVISEYFPFRPSTRRVKMILGG